MKQQSIRLFIVATILFVFGLKNASAADNNLIENLLSQMTLEEKLGQMTLYSSGEDPLVPVFNPSYKQEIKEGRCGAIFASITPDSIRYLQELAMQSRLKIPMLFGYDVIHGYKTIFPIPLAQAASFNLDLIRKSAQVAATEASSRGINWFFGPMIDIARDARWGRVSEGAGEDPFLTSKVAVEMIKGYQGENLSERNNVAACAKHFAAYGAPIGGKDYNTVIMSLQELNDVYLAPHKAAADAQVASFMSAFNEINGMPCSANRELLTDILQKQWKYKGFVVTDFATIREFMNHGIAENEEQCAQLAIQAGVSMDMESGIYKAKYVENQLKSKSIDIEKIDEAVRRILTIKYRMGLFADPFKYCNSKTNELMTANNLTTAREIARESMVLLKNDKQTLPIKSDIRKIALIGPLADNQADMLGTWIAQGDTSDVVTLLQGLKKQLGTSAQVEYAQGCDIDTKRTSMFNKAIALAKKSDVIVVVLGEKGDMAGEAASRGNINLPGVQTALLKALYATKKPVILVLMNGRPLALEEEMNYCDAILEAWQPGTIAGDAIADVLLGKYNPSGKLPVTFPRCVGQVPIFYAAKSTGRPSDAKVRYSSRYLDIPFTPLFPFGFGLSYTTFEYSELSVSHPEIGLNDEITIQVKVKNSGKIAGQEVVQLYLKDDIGQLTRPVRELKGFQKIQLNAGESKVVTFTLKPSVDLIYTHADGTQNADAGKFTVFVGGNSDANLLHSFRVK
ncbi:MAG: beta-glucosidase BglX [Bacteroidales bacterium]|nr:beta-glucosidase BglX [Bacteroidales bacterium]